MFRHTLLLAYRSFLRFKSTFFINLIGLSAGLAGALLIYLWVSDELAVDKFHEKDHRLFQVMQNFPTANAILTIEATPGILAEALIKEIPEVEDAAVAVTPTSGGGTNGIISVENTPIKARELYVSQNFFNFFSYKLLQGDKEGVLRDKYAVLLSEELAMKLFHSTKNIIGKTIEWNQEGFSGSYIISGVFENLPRNSSTQFDLLFNYELFLEKQPHMKTWDNSGPGTYVRLKEGTSVEELHVKIKDFIKSKFKAANGTKNLEWIGTLFLQRYSDRYLYNNFQNGVQAGGRIQYVKLFSVIAVFILIISCINFMNLSTAKASRRLKEIGIKKVIGANRKTLILQYLSESILLTWLSSILAMFLVALLLPQFNQITSKQLSLNLNTNLILSVLSITLITGLISGSYPALYLSGFKPITILKGKFSHSSGEARVRKGLVVFQFAISIILIVSVLVVYKQINFIQTRNLGYNKDNIIQFSNEGKLKENLRAFLIEAKNIPGVINAASFAHDLTGNHGGTPDLNWPGKNPGAKIQFEYFEVDYGLLETMGFKITQGRAFSGNFGADSSNIIFNEAAIAAMGIKDPIGKTIKLWGNDRRIVGVVKNFHFESLYEKVKPCFLIFIPNGKNILVKIAAGTERKAIERIGKLYKEFNQGLPFEYKFLDEDYQKLYAAENRVAILSRYFAGIAILISCLGLFGLAAFTAERRRKEIGVRKVLGASRVSIVYLLSADFTKMVLISICLSLPLSYLIVKNWLQSFEYRISLEWWYFVGAGLAALLIAWFTVSTQAVRAASVNPAQSLKDE